ncbi:MAG: hypothetical protein M3Q55_09270 [Acidobacteriota bacterium]|nr:hypothetical protein [Acidobacteriota bacterium]
MMKASAAWWQVSGKRNAVRLDGKLVVQLKCAGCGKPAGNDPMADHDTGHIVCDRAPCVKRLDTMTSEARKAYYAARAK